MLAIITSTPGLEARAKDRATAYVERFFADIASEQSTTAKVLKSCL